MPKPKLKKMGNPNNQGVDGFRGVSAEVLRAKRLAKNTPAGQADANRPVSYDPAAVRAAIEAQICPLCGAGPYKVVATHVSQKHGVDRRELRDMAGLRLIDSICSAESSRKARDNALRNETAKAAIEASRGKRKPRKWTQAGLARMAEGSAAAGQVRRTTAAVEHAVLVEQFKALGGGLDAVETLADQHGVTRQSMRERLIRHGYDIPDARPVANDRRRRIREEDRLTIGRLYAEGLSQSQIAKRFGVQQSHVSKILRDDGIQARPFARSSWNGDTEGRSDGR